MYTYVPKNIQIYYSMAIPNNFLFSPKLVL